MENNNSISDIPQEYLDSLKELLMESEDQWETALTFAASLNGAEQDHFARAVAQHSAVALVSRVAQNANRRIRIYHGWEMIDGSTVLTEAHDGLIRSSGVITDEGETALVLAPYESLLQGGEDAWVVIRYLKVWNIEIDWEPHELEGPSDDS
jgi:hypothetical protein